jgi:hypothetical protein
MLVATRELAQSSWVERSARAGLAAKGASYIIVAILAIQVALGGSGQAENRQGALATVADEPFGWALLLLLAAGFGGYAIWRFAQAFFDREQEGEDPIGLGKRLGYLAVGVLYAALCILAVGILAGSAEGGSGGEKKAAATVLDWPAGRWLVGAVGVGVVAGSLYLAYRACTAKFREDLRTGTMKEAARRWYTVLGTFGHLARAVVFALVGIFLVKAAVEFDPQEAIGLDGALQELAGRPYGAYLLGTVAFGLLAYGLFCLVEARYREV